MLAEIPPNSTAVGIPAKVVRTAGKRVNSDLDQIHIPDPVSAEMNELKRRVDELERILSDISDAETAGEVSSETVDIDGVGEIDVDDPELRDIFDADEE